MLTVVFASGERERVAFNPGQTVAALLDAMRCDPRALQPAPGRERAFLRAALCGSVVRSTGEKDASGPASDAPGGMPGTSGELDVHGAAFVDDKPFPPRQLPPDATLEAAGVSPETAVHVTYLPRQVLVDPIEAAKTAPKTPSHFVRCREIKFEFGGIKSDLIVYCDASCGRVGEVYGGDGCYTRDSALCRAALHAGAVVGEEPAYYTVRQCGQRERFPAVMRGVVQTMEYRAPFGAIRITSYAPGDDITTPEYS